MQANPNCASRYQQFFKTFCWLLQHAPSELFWGFFCHKEVPTPSREMGKVHIWESKCSLSNTELIHFLLSVPQEWQIQTLLFSNALRIKAMKKPADLKQSGTEQNFGVELFKAIWTSIRKSIQKNIMTFRKEVSSKKLCSFSHLDHRKVSESQGIKIPTSQEKDLKTWCLVEIHFNERPSYFSKPFTGVSSLHSLGKYFP